MQNKSSSDRKILKKKLKTIERQIDEIENRLPAHSVKPALMIALFDLEEARDRLLEELKRVSAD